MGLRLAVLVTGASGMRLPIHALRLLSAEDSIEALHLVVSKGAAKVLEHELAAMVDGAGTQILGTQNLLETAELSSSQLAKIETHTDDELDATIASGSYRLDGTAVLPCSAGTLGGLAAGHSGTLTLRAGAVALKEGWPLVLCFRETPLSRVHIENMRHLAYRGAVLLPPVPAFYVGGSSLERFLNAYTQRLFDCLGVDVTLDPSLRWSGGKP